MSREDVRLAERNLFDYQHVCPYPVFITCSFYKDPMTNPGALWKAQADWNPSGLWQLPCVLGETWLKLPQLQKGFVQQEDPEKMEEAFQQHCMHVAGRPNAWSCILQPKATLNWC